jgi:hypothetical protein
MVPLRSRVSALYWADMVSVRFTFEEAPDAHTGVYPQTFGIAVNLAGLSLFSADYKIYAANDAHGSTRERPPFGPTDAYHLDCYRCGTVPGTSSS